MKGEFIIHERSGGFSVDLRRLLAAKREELKALLARQHRALRLPVNRTAES